MSDKRKEAIEWIKAFLGEEGRDVATDEEKGGKEDE